jgi:D-galactarolactone isomerase
MHFYGAPGRARTPSPFTVPRADVPAYREVMSRLGLSRVVAVQSLLYKTDNSIMLSAVAELGDCARGVAVIDPWARDDALGALADRGVRGVRAFMLFDPIYSWGELEPLSIRIRDFGWHLQIQMNGRDLEEHAARIARLRCPVVIDHTGKFVDPVGIDHPAFVALRRLVAGGNCWVKLSGQYETSKSGAPFYDDVVALGRILAAEAPERMLWGSNWPHPNQQPPPDDVELLNLFSTIVPGEAARRQILVDNPVQLFGFARAMHGEAA